MNNVKNLKPVAEAKTPGTVAVAKHRPLLNKLTEVQRRRLRQRAAALLYGLPLSRTIPLAQSAGNGQPALAPAAATI
jgi:hypothetical protein